MPQQLETLNPAEFKKTSCEDEDPFYKAISRRTTGTSDHIIQDCALFDNPNGEESDSILQDYYLNQSQISNIGFFKQETKANSNLFNDNQYINNEE